MTPGGTTVIAQTIVPVPVTQGLIVLPRINGDESLTLFGTAISTSLGAPITGPNGESFPNITQQTAPIQRIIRNGDTMVISGLTSKNDVLTENRVPLLGDLPLIGNLFRSRNTTTSDAELLVFIRRRSSRSVRLRRRSAAASAARSPIPADPGAAQGVAWCLAAASKAQFRDCSGTGARRP